MNVKAFVLIETEIGKTNQVMKTLQEIDSLQTVDAVTGPYDIIALLEKEDLLGLGKIITEKIHCMECVRRVVTCVCPCASVPSKIQMLSK